MATVARRATAGSQRLRTMVLRVEAPRARRVAVVSPESSWITSTKRTTESNYVTVGIADKTLTLAVVLVAWVDHFDSGLPPLLGDPVGVLTVHVENSVASCFILRCLGKMNREVSVSVRECIGVVVERHIESRAAEPGNGAGHISDLEDGLKTGHQPCARHELQLAVSLSIEPVEAVVADRQVGM